MHLVRGRPILGRPAARIAWEQAVLPLHLRARSADLIHGLVNVLPMATNLPGVVTVHDLSFLRMPDKFPASKRLYLAWLCRASVAKAAHVIAVSRQTAADLVYFFGVDDVKISVIPHGVDARFAPAGPQAVELFRRRNALPERFLFYLGTLEPRKNLELFLTAFAAWHAQAAAEDRSVKLVLAGAKGWFYQEIFRRVAELGLEESVLFPGYLPDADLPDRFRAAEAFVYPSVFEGFGLPVLEAMACGTPVLCSRAAALLEVAGDNALTVPAYDVAAWVAGIALLTGQAAVRDELRRRGLRQAAQFTWQKAACATWHVYETVLG